MKQVLGISDEKTRMKVTPPLAVAPITQEGCMTCDGTRTNKGPSVKMNDDGIVSNP